MPLSLFKKDDTHQFRPILAEIEEEPASPLGKSVFWTIILVGAFFVGWAIWGEMDVVISARGKIVPVGNVKVLQPLGAGVIRKINVKEGDFVHKGEVLLTIDPATTEPALASYRENLQYLEMERSRLNAATRGGSFGASGDGTQQALYQASHQKLQRQIDSKQAMLQQLEARASETKVNITHLEEDLAILSEKKQRLEAVKDLIARDTYEDVTNKILVDQSQLKQKKYELEELAHQRQQTAEDIEVIRESFKTDTLMDLSDKEKRITELRANVAQLTFQNAHQSIVAPVDGYVQTLFVNTVGGVVSPAEKLISIVPAKTPLKVQAAVQNKDIGYVKSGLPVAIKVDTYDFQKYGTVQGVVSHIPKDSTEEGQSQQSEAMVTGEQRQGSVYLIDVIPSQRFLLVDGKKENLAVGLNVTAEIKVGKRRIIEFFIYPLIKHWNEGMSVR